MSNNDEYLRRNLIVAQAAGVRAGLETMLRRAKMTRRLPKWLLRGLEAELERAQDLPGELARWRDHAHHE